jgi:8-oxo-dGTP diphosphatase
MLNTPLLTVDCVVFYENSVVLIRRKNDPFKNWLALPGGFVDIGETVEEACSRELKEETNLYIPEEDLKLVGVYSNPKRDVRNHIVSVVFMGQSYSKSLKPGDDASYVEFVIDWREKNLAFDHKKIIEDAYLLFKGME